MTVVAERPDELAEVLSPDFINGLMPIAQSTLTGSVASVTFSSISADFRSLMLILQLRTDIASNNDQCMIRFNGDGGNNYDWVRGFFRGDGTRGSTGLLAQSSGEAAFIEGATSRASNFSVATVQLSGYKQTDREKFAICKSAQFRDTSAVNDLLEFMNSVRWRDTSAITSITLLPATGPNFVSGSIFSLYGIL